MNNAESILKMLEGRVESLTAKYDKLPLECDGMTKVLTYVLKQNKIKHKIYQGQVKYKGKVSIPLHFWIVLNDGQIVDYRLRMWMDNKKKLPHGVFKAEQYPDVKYEGKLVKMEVSDMIFRILTIG